MTRSDASPPATLPPATSPPDTSQSATSPSAISPSAPPVALDPAAGSARGPQGAVAAPATATDIGPTLARLKAGTELDWVPALLDISAWPMHVPFAYWLIKQARPLTLVELGTHAGVSYFAFCQAVDRLGLTTRCFAVDTWQGDEHAGHYGEEVFARVQRFNDEHYLPFSTLLRTTFDAAATGFGAGEIDLLHIDGLHTYEAVKSDFETWLPKLSARAIVLFHDISVRDRNFGVWRLWHELRPRYPFFEFHHGHGLGVLAVGAEASLPLFTLSASDIAATRAVFAARGDAVRNRMLLRERALQFEQFEAALRDRDQRFETAVRERDQQLEAVNGRVTDLEQQLARAQSLVAEHQQARAQAEQAHHEDQQRYQEQQRQLEQGAQQRQVLQQALAERDAASSQKDSSLRAISSRSAPWFAKAAAKIILSRLPISYSAWSNAKLFRHGRNDDPAYSFAVFQSHLKLAQPSAGFVCVEIGPGDAVASAVLTRAFGGDASYQIDVGSFATPDIEVYRRIAAYACGQQLPAPALDGVPDFAAMLKACHAQYLTRGIDSLQTIPAASVDFVFSHACLQLVKAAQFAPFLKELRRILRPDGCMTHQIPFTNHLDKDANSLRFSDRLWESDFVLRSGFYTNRLAPSEVIAAFESAGFDCEIVAREQRERMPGRGKLAARFRSISDQDLGTSALLVKATPI